MTTMEDSLFFRNASDLDPKLSAALLRWGLALADSKYLLGRRLSEWVNGAPTLEAAVGTAAMTQDELGHARSLFSMLREFPGAPEELGTETDLQRTDYFSPTTLGKPWDSWADVVAVNVLFDRALNLIFAATRDSSFGPLSQRTAKVLQEEQFHRIFGDSWFARLATSDAENRQRLHKALEKAWSLSEAWIGPDNDPTAIALAEVGILSTSAGALRRQWWNSVQSLMKKHDINIQPAQLDWESWDPDRREVIKNA